MANPELEYFNSVYQGFLDFQSGAVASVPTKPSESDKGAYQIYQRAMRAAAEATVEQANGSLETYRTWFNGVDPVTGSKWVETHAPANARAKDRHAWLDSNQDGVLYREGNLIFRGDSAVITAEGVTSYTEAVAGAIAVKGVYDQFASAHRATGEDLVVNLIATKEELENAHFPKKIVGGRWEEPTTEAERAATYAKGDFPHRYGTVTHTLSTALGEETGLPKLEKHYAIVMHLASTQLDGAVQQLQRSVNDALQSHHAIDANDKGAITTMVEKVLQLRVDAGGKFTEDQQAHLEETLKTLKPYLKETDTRLQQDIAALHLDHGLGGTNAVTTPQTTR